MGKINTAYLRKRCMFIVSFLLIFIIDWVNTTQNGDYMSFFNNLTGIALLVLLAYKYPLKRINKFFAIPWSVICLSAAITVIVLGLSGKTQIMYTYYLSLVIYIADIWWAVLLTSVHFIEKCIRKTSSFKTVDLVFWLWTAFTFFASLARYEHIWPAVFFFMFSVYYLTEYTFEEWHLIFDSCIDASILAFAGTTLFTYLFRPFDQPRYSGAYGNENMFGLVLIIQFSLILCRIYNYSVQKKAKWRILLYFILETVICGFILLTGCRTCVLVALPEMVVFVFCIIRKLRQKWYHAAGFLAALVLGTILLFPGVYFSVRIFPALCPHTVWFRDEYSEDRVHSGEDIKSDKFTSFEETIEMVTDRFLPIDAILGQSNKPKSVLVASTKTIPLFGNGKLPPNSSVIRMTIYTSYLQDLKLNGHYTWEGLYKIDDLDYYSYHAQNLWIQVLFSLGIPAGVLFIALTLAILFKDFKQFLKIDDPYLLIPLFITITFFVFGLTELVWNYGQAVLALMFLGALPYVKGKEN